MKQFLLTLVCSADGGVPLWLQVASGNRYDSEVFARVLKDFSEQWTQEGVFVIAAHLPMDYAEVSGYPLD